MASYPRPTLILSGAVAVFMLAIMNSGAEDPNSAAF
jgi:hypothetical protein